MRKTKKKSHSILPNLTGKALEKFRNLIPNNIGHPSPWMGKTDKIFSFINLNLFDEQKLNERH